MNSKDVNKLLWYFAALMAFAIGLGLWTFIAANTVVVGALALVLFSTIALTSAIGIGATVGYCVKQGMDII